MKREIKFRAWCAKDKMMYANVHQGIHFDDGSAYEFRCFLNPPPNDYHEWKLMQFTGLKDVNNVEIYEGDIVVGGGTSLSEPAATAVKGHPVSFENGCFMWRREPLAWDLTESEVCLPERWATVIGNIYSNPELLKSTPLPE